MTATRRERVICRASAPVRSREGEHAGRVRGTSLHGAVEPREEGPQVRAEERPITISAFGLQESGSAGGGQAFSHTDDKLRNTLGLVGLS